MLRLSDDTTLPTRFRDAACVLFDCDGVIFDSNGFKIDAMRTALASYSATEIERMLTYWRRNGGVSRWVKFRHFFEHIVETDDVDAAVEEACSRFGEASLEAYSHQEPVPQALRAARFLGAARSVVVSGASQTELETVFRSKGIDSCFAAILGSPRTKRELCELVLEARGIRGSDAVFVGDGGGDFRVAQQLEIPFVYLNQFTEWHDAARVLADADNVTWAEDWPSLLAAMTQSESSP